MIMLSQPVTIEDWLGNIYLIKPVAMKPHLADINQNSSVTFNKPHSTERQSKMIKRIMVATTIDKQSISSLLRSLKQQLQVDLNLDNISVFKMCSNSQTIDRTHEKDRPKRMINMHRMKLMAREMLPGKTSSKSVSSYPIDCRETSSVDTTTTTTINERRRRHHRHHHHNRLSKTLRRKSIKISNLDSLINDSNRHSVYPQIELHKSEPHWPHTNNATRGTSMQKAKFTFLTCWYANEQTNGNYFLLPHDRVTNLQVPLPPCHHIPESKRHLLTRYIKMIEKIADSRIKYKSIVHSRRLEHLFYRKITISSTDDNGIWLSLQLLQQHVDEVIRNAIFYRPSLNQSNQPISPALMSQLQIPPTSVEINYASENCVTDPLSFCKHVSKLSKIPVLLSQKQQRFTTSSMKKSATAVDVLPCPATNEIGCLLTIGNNCHTATNSNNTSVIINVNQCLVTQSVA